MARIVTSHVHPPIPTRNCDWCAYREGSEEEGNYGWGATELAAIGDLLQWEFENDIGFEEPYQEDEDA